MCVCLCVYVCVCVHVCVCVCLCVFVGHKKNKCCSFYQVGVLHMPLKPKSSLQAPLLLYKLSLGATCYMSNIESQTKGFWFEAAKKGSYLP